MPCPDCGSPFVGVGVCPNCHRAPSELDTRDTKVLLKLGATVLVGVAAFAALASWGYL